tara:strand:+ start:911 stop:1294 length:384 start_codon:yes stop_codon:yes gene_type:complete
MALTSNKKRYYYVEGRRIALIENTSKTVDNTTSEYSSISEVKTLRVKSISRESDFTTDLTETWDEIPTQFHDVIVDSVIAELYTRPGTVDLSAYQVFRERYERGLRGAKKYSKGGQIRTGSITPHEF